MSLSSYLADDNQGGGHRQEVAPTPSKPGESDEQELVAGLEVALAA